MKKLSRLFVATGVAAVMAILSAPAFAASPSEDACTQAGGTFDRTNGEVSCTFTETGKNDKFTQTNETTGQGNTGNKTDTSTECGGTGSGKCPGGQFK